MKAYKFKADEYGDRALEFADKDGDRLRVVHFNDGSITLAVNGAAVIFTPKQLRKFAISILKESCK